MKTTDKAVAVSPQTTRTKYDAVLLTIRSRKSFFEVTQAIESSMQRFHTPKLMEYVTHGNRAVCRGLRRLDFEANGNLLGLRAGLHDAPRGDSHRVKILPCRECCHCAWFVRVHRCRRLGRSRAHLRVPAGRRGDTDRHGSTVGIFQQIPRDTAIDCARSARRDVDKALRGCRCIGQHDEMKAVWQEHFS
jgi:hypothetical protein